MIIKGGVTSNSIDVQIVDDTGLAVTGLLAATFPTLTYSLGDNVAAASFPALSDLAAITTAYASGGVKERSGGWYRLDCPDAMFATAGKKPHVLGEASGKHVLHESIQLVAFDPTDAVRAGLTALPNANAAATGGLIILGSNTGTQTMSGPVTYTGGFVATITGSLSGSVGSVTGAVGSVTGAVGSVTGNVGGSVASVTAAVSLTAAESGVIGSGTATAGAASTITLQTALGADSLPVGCLIKITSGTGIGQARIITAYVNSTKVTTVDRAWTTNPDNTSVYSIMFGEAAALSSGLKITGVVLTDTATTAGSVSGAVGSVTGAVGSVTGAVGSVTGNVGGNVVGSVASVTGNVGGNVVGSVASVTGNVGGNVVGSTASVSGAVGSVTGNVGGNVVGSVASVVGAVGSVTGNLGGNVNGNVTGSVGSVVGAVGSVTGAVGSVTGNVGGSLTGDVGGKVLGGGASSITGDGVRASSVSGAVGSVTGAVGSVSGAVGSVTGGVGGDVSGKVLGGGAGTISGDGVRAASVTGAVGSVTGAVGSVTAGVTVSTNNDKTGYALTAAYDSAKTAAQAGDAMALTSGERTTLTAAIWNAVTSGLTTAGSIGKRLVEFLTTLVYVAPDNTGIATAAAQASAAATSAATAATNSSAIKLVTDKFDSTLEAGVGAGVFRFTAAALVKAPSGGGGGGSLIVAPLQTTLQYPLFVTNGGTIFNLYLAQNSSSSPVFTVTDGSGNPVVLTGHELRFVIHDNTGIVISELKSTNGGITISSNQATVLITGTNTPAVESLQYKLWDITLETVLASGAYTVRLAPQGT